MKLGLWGALSSVTTQTPTFHTFFTTVYRKTAITGAKFSHPGALRKSWSSQIQEGSDALLEIFETTKKRVKEKISPAHSFNLLHDNHFIGSRSGLPGEVISWL